MDARMRTVSLVVSIDRLLSRLHNRYSNMPAKGIIKLLRRQSLKEAIHLCKDWVSPDSKMYLRALIIRRSVDSETRNQIIKEAREYLTSMGAVGGDQMIINVGHLRVVVDFIFEGSDTVIALVVKTTR